MQIVQTLNDFIKVLFTPSTENLCLGDFLLIQEANERYLGQIVEVADDKFDDSKNIAQIKLTHSINDEGEITDFNYHTPSKQCQILYANTREIFHFINEGKRTFKFGEDFKFSRPFEFNIDFFKNSPLIFCDTIKEYNRISGQLAQKLSDFRNVILLDYTGSLDVEGAQRLRAKVDFKLPLDYFSLDSIWEKGLSSASLETQAICEEIFNELKNYAKTAKDKFIPFNQFVKVVQAQHKKTPIKELLVLKNRLQNYQQEEIFANLKKEFTWIFEQIGKEKITIIDLSQLKSIWHKDFTEFILRHIKLDTFVFMRLNENNFDNDLLNLIYLKNRKYSVIPSISNLFAKLSTLMEHCPNFIILPSQNVRKDFGCLSAAITAMPEGTAMLYGQDSNNFAFLVKNMDREFEDKDTKIKKPVVKITFEGDVIKNKRVKEKITQLNNKKEREIEEDVDKFLSAGIKIPTETQEPVIEITVAEKELFGQPTAHEALPVEIEQENLPIQEDVFNYNIEDVISEEDLDLFDALNAQEAKEAENALLEEIARADIIFEEVAQTTETAQTIETTQEVIQIDVVPEEIALTDLILEETLSTDIIFEEKSIKEESLKANMVVVEEELLIEETEEKFEVETTETIVEKPIESPIEESVTEDLATLLVEKPAQEELTADESINKAFEEIIEAEYTVQPDEPIEIEDILQKSTEEPEEEFNEIPNEDTVVENVEEFSLEDFADQVMSEFLGEETTNTTLNEELMPVEAQEEDIEPLEENTTPLEEEILPAATEEAPEITIEQRKAQNLNALQYIEEIPIYTPEEPQVTEGIEEEDGDGYSEGCSVLHDTYGEGKVLQVVEYADKVLLQIEFERIGKRLLDPIAANIRRIRQ